MSLDFDIVAVTSLVLSVVAILISLQIRSINRKQYELNSFAIKEAKFIDIEYQICDSPELLRFHGIDHSEIEAVGLSPKEFSYLLANFTAGGIRARAHNEKYDDIEITEYRMVMLKSKSTREAWPLIRKMMNDSAYRRKIDDLVRELS